MALGIVRFRRSALLLIAVAALSAATVRADYVPVLDKSCPEGCRTGDLTVSCGSESNAVWCYMNTGGNVTVQCIDGHMYCNTNAGCLSSVNETIRYAWLCQSFDTRTVLRFMMIFEHVYASPKEIYDGAPAYLIVSLIEIVVVLYLWIFGLRFIRLTRVLVGAIIGELIAMLAMAAFNVTLDTLWNHTPLWIGPVALGILSGCWRRALRFLCGLGTGFMLGVIVVYESYTRQHKDDIDATVFYVMVAMMGFFTVLGSPFQYEAFNSFATFFSALCGTAAIIQLGGPYLKSTCNSASSCITGCPEWVPEAVFLGLAIIASIALCLGYRARRKRAQEDDYVPMNRPLNTRHPTYGSQSSRA